MDEQERGDEEKAGASGAWPPEELFHPARGPVEGNPARFDVVEVERRLAERPPLEGYPPELAELRRRTEADFLAYLHRLEEVVFAGYQGDGATRVLDFSWALFGLMKQVDPVCQGDFRTGSLISYLLPYGHRCRETYIGWTHAEAEAQERPGYPPREAPGS